MTDCKQEIQKQQMKIGVAKKVDTAEHLHVLLAFRTKATDRGVERMYNNDRRQIKRGEEQSTEQNRSERVKRRERDVLVINVLVSEPY